MAKAKVDPEKIKKIYLNTDSLSQFREKAVEAGMAKSSATAKFYQLRKALPKGEATPQSMVAEVKLDTHTIRPEDIQITTQAPSEISPDLKESYARMLEESGGSAPKSVGDAIGNPEDNASEESPGMDSVDAGAASDGIDLGGQFGSSGNEKKMKIEIGELLTKFLFLLMTNSYGQNVLFLMMRKES